MLHFASKLTTSRRETDHSTQARLTIARQRADMASQVADHKPRDI